MDSLSLANLRQRPLRTAVSMAGVSLGVVLVTLMGGLTRGMTRDAANRQSNVDAEIRFLPGGPISITTSNPLMLSARYADALLHGIQPTPDNPAVEARPPVAGVMAATPVGQYLQAAGAIGFELVDGVDFQSLKDTSRIRIIKGHGLGDGSDEQSAHEAIVDKYYAEKNVGLDNHPVRVGSSIKVLDQTFTVAGIYDPPMLARVKIPLKTMQELFGGADNCSFVMIKVEKPEMIKQVIDTLNEYYPGNNVIPTSEIPALYSQNLFAVDVLLDVVVGLASVISTLVILLGMYTTITERTREIGILKSLGASKRLIVSIIEREAALISLLGVILGFVLSVIGRYSIQSSTRLIVDLDLKWILIAATIGMLGGLLGAFYPAVRAANLDPVEALSYE
ncbi:MAG: hypothetical protein DMF61_16385 [Blastocatellia bacterium AA13]|nr:MAG: hypothetical protein DMF61_16385 [Blastocatellia bacterium AA13]